MDVITNALGMVWYNKKTMMRQTDNKKKERKEIRIKAQNRKCLFGELRDASDWENVIISRIFSVYIYIFFVYYIVAAGEVHTKIAPNRLKSRMGHSKFLHHFLYSLSFFFFVVPREKAYKIHDNCVFYLFYIIIYCSCIV